MEDCDINVHDTRSRMKKGATPAAAAKRRPKVPSEVATVCKYGGQDTEVRSPPGDRNSDDGEKPIQKL